MSEPYPTETDVAIRVEEAQEKAEADALSTHSDVDAEAAVPFYMRNLTRQKNWPLYRLRYWLREYLAEFLGTLLLVLCGDGVVATANFKPNYATIDQQGMAQYLGITFGWGFGLCIALYVCMGVSGGHLNPAVTIANAVFGAFPWRKVPGYCFSQILGGFVGAACMWGLFRNFFDAAEERLALMPAPRPTMTQAYGGIFCTYPAVRNGYAAYSELLNTALLMLGILGINDERMTPAINFKPVAVGLLVFVIGICTGFTSGYAINPARDLGPRMFSAVVYGREAFTLNSHYFWIPMFMPVCGAMIGMLLYVLLIIPKEL